ncbi:hypothetical protein SLE2022_329990 [Rubroshorea leprosula]
MYSLHDHTLHCPLLPPIGRNWKSTVELAPNCPRCASSNTKFCYYNNYSLSQPRYFCKGCRRYWTKGGSLRNIPVGGGCRRNRRANSARISQTDRGSSKTLNSFVPNRNAPESDPMSETGSSNGSSDIDLAVVFANFLNNNDDDENASFSPEFVSQESAPVNETNSNSLKPDGSQNPSDPIQEMPQLLEGNIQTRPQEQSVQEFWETDMNPFGLQNLVNDEAVQDAPWPDAATTSTATAANLSWQPVMQMQEFNSFSGDHDLLKNFSANLATDNWSTHFDPTNFETFFETLT